MLGLLVAVTAQIPDVIVRGDPKAIALYQEVVATYRGLGSFKCRVVDCTKSSHVVSADLAYHRPGDVYVRVSRENRANPSEIRYRNGEVTVSSSLHPELYFPTRFTPSAPWITPLSDGAKRAGLNLDDFAVLFDGASPPTEGKFVRTLRLLAPEPTSDGLPADVLVEDQASAVHRADRWVTTDRRITYQLGKKDHLVRRLTEEFLSNRGPRTTLHIYFLDPKANPPIPDSLFVFKPPKGAKPVGNASDLGLP